MELKNNIKTFYAKSQKDWRKWLEKNHQSEKSVWLIIYKKESGKKSVYYPEAVDEALCFGWIDSKPNKRDAESYYQFFTKRNPKSNWSKINKEKVEKLIAKGLMQKAGYAMIEIAKKNGNWTALDKVEDLTLPDELKRQFKKNKKAFENWEKFPPSSKKIILEWILNAKKDETRKNRIEETVKLAEKNLKANHYRQ
jgi:uncharacterized protein YdeI (YjbR/CyaY-like superfamily)